MKEIFDQDLRTSHQLKTSDFAVMVTLVALAASIFTTTIVQALQDNRPDRARSGAEALALQLKIQNDLGEKSHGRGPASAQTEAPPLTDGSIGHDPWGRPFHFVVRETPDNEKVIFVWSEGPNGKSDSDPTSIPVADLRTFQFSADDAGFAHWSK